MTKIKSFDIAYEVIKEAEKRFAPTWVLDKENLNVFHQYCDKFDEIVDMIECESVEFEIDENTMNTIVRTEGHDAEVCKESKLIWRLVERADVFGVYGIDDENIRLEFVFPSLWVRA